MLAIPPTNVYDSLGEPFAQSVKTLLTLDWYY